MVTGNYLRDGFTVLPFDPRVAAWADAARVAAQRVLEGPTELRHGNTWNVGVDALPNDADGSIGKVPLKGGWDAFVVPPAEWHPAQLSVVYPGYPRQDALESDGAHRFRLNKDAAHVDGLLPEGTQKRRHLREPHAFVLGLPLNPVAASPLVVWPGSHTIMGRAFEAAYDGIDPRRWGDVDVTEIYQSARRDVFDTCVRTECLAVPGEASLMHRHMLHGVAPWGDHPPDLEGRMIAYFRPMLQNMQAWL